MSLIKRDRQSLSPFSFADDDFNNLFQGFFRPITDMESSGKRLPAVNIDEKKDRYLVSAELPGFDKSDINVSIQDGLLTINAEHNEETKKEEEGNILNERRHESFYRTLNLGRNIAENDVSASYDKGILKMTLLKHEPESNQRNNINIE